LKHRLTVLGRGSNPAVQFSAKQTGRDDLDSESFFAGVAGAGPSLGQSDFGLKSPKQQLFKSHPPHLPKVALFPAGGQLAFALLVEGQDHLKHLSSSLILY